MLDQTASLTGHHCTTVLSSGLLFCCSSREVQDLNLCFLAALLHCILDPCVGCLYSSLLADLLTVFLSLFKIGLGRRSSHWTTKAQPSRKIPSYYLVQHLICSNRALLLLSLFYINFISANILANIFNIWYLTTKKDIYASSPTSY